MHLIYNKSLFFLICKKGRCVFHSDLFHKYSIACKFAYNIYKKTSQSKRSNSK